MENGVHNRANGKGLPNDAFESDFASFKTSADDADTEIVPRTVTYTPIAGLSNFLNICPRKFFDWKYIKVAG